jgi:subfamily B ATP-binding cassette protein MsbA
VFELLGQRGTVRDPARPRSLPRPGGWALRFDDVWFRYGDELPWALRAIDLEIPPGQVVALVGPSGAGKSTVVHLIPRLYEIARGGILVDGHDVRSVTLQSLRGQIAMVMQDTFLFDGTVRANIAYGRPDATEAEIVDASVAAHVHEFVERFEEGYDTLVGERGVKLSGGEGQRVSIARAILAGARILILDEPTSSVDTESERLIQDSLDRLMKGRTTFVIAHRLSTILGADKIVVLDRGRVVGVGTHEQLMEGNDLYRRLYTVQFNYDAFNQSPGS